MDHLSEVLKIIDGALKSNQSMAANYAGLLADKLEADGSRREARLIRERLARVPAAQTSLQSGEQGHPSQGPLPVDADSRLSTVDLTRPELEANQLILPSAIAARLEGFLQGIRSHAQLLAANLSMPPRMILDGPPGTGKTQTARWIASSLSLRSAGTRTSAEGMATDERLNKEMVDVCPSSEIQRIGPYDHRE